MKFYDNQDLGKIIENYKKRGEFYLINYLDGNTAGYYNMNENYEKELKQKMLDQAIKRDDELYELYEKIIKRRTLELSTSILLSILCVKGDLKILFCAWFIYMLIAGKRLIEDYAKYKELNKYHNYILMKEDLEKTENSDILDIIEFDRFYQIPININTIDKYTDDQIKVLKKEIQKRKKQTN